MSNGFVELRYRGVPIVFDDEVKTDTIEFVNTKKIKWFWHLRKDGKPDMRYRANKIAKLLGMKPK